MHITMAVLFGQKHQNDHFIKSKWKRNVRWSSEMILRAATFFNNNILIPRKFTLNIHNLHISSPTDLSDALHLYLIPPNP